MRRFFLAVGIGFLLAACSPLMSSDDAKEARDEVNALLEAGEITHQQAEWRREDIARMESFYRFDMENLLSLLGVVGAATGVNLGAIRYLRGPSKPAAPEEWAAIKAKAAQ